MKQQLLLLILTFFLGFTATYSQESLTHKIVENLDDDTQKYTEIVKEEYTYNDQGHLIESRTYYWISIVWTPANRTQYTYDSNGNVTESIFSSWNDSSKSFLNRDRSVNTYNDNKLIGEMKYNWDDGQWKQKDKTDLVYAGNNIESSHSYEWNGMQWTDDDRATFNYELNKLSNITIEEFENNVWVPSDKTIFVRNASTDRIQDIIYQNWNGTEWDNEDKITYSIDSNGNRLTEIYSESNDGITWIEDDKIEYTYDNNTLLSKYYNPFKVNSYLQNIGLEDLPHYNKVLSSLTSENESDQIPQPGNAAWEIESKTTYYYSDDTMGLNDLSDSNFVTVYPNPIKNILKIKLKDQIKADVSLFDINGRLVLEQKIEALNTSLNIEVLNSGVYILKIRAENGFATKRLTKN